MADSVAKKLETSVIGPGLAAPAKNASTEGRGGSVMVGRVGGDAVSVSDGLAVDMLYGGWWLVKKLKRKRKMKKMMRFFSFVCVFV